jgi:hypothetical protein
MEVENMQNSQKILAYLWLPFPPILLSALIHTTDPDIGGVQGLASASTLLSVFVFSLPAIVFAVLCLVIWNQTSRTWALLAMILFAGFTALFLTTAGSGATTPLGLAWTFVGSTILTSLVLGIAFLPAALLTGNASKRLDSPSLSS